MTLGQRAGVGWAGSGAGGREVNRAETEAERGRVGLEVEVGGAFEQGIGTDVTGARHHTSYYIRIAYI